MPILRAIPPHVETDVEKATDESKTEEDWGVIIDICDKAGKNSDDAKAYLKVILKRIANQDPHIALKAVTLLDACVKNSGKTFHLEVASREFESEYQKLIGSGKTHPKVTEKLRESLRKWAEDETFKKDPQLTLIPTLYSNLRSKGIDFSVENSTTKKFVMSKDPNVVQSQEEEDQIAKAIELSLREVGNSPRNTAATSSSLYPSTNLTMTPSSTPQKELKKVRALYDFEAAEDNELTFNSGEIILVIDDSDQNWWKGSNHRGEGLFPANFVTTDLDAEPESERKKSVHFEDLSTKIIKEPENVEIDEVKVNRLLHLLHEADPTNSENDTEEMLNLEREVNAMGPLIDAELERVDRKHAQLTQLSTDLVEAFSLYHSLMREPQFSALHKTTQPYSINYQSNIPLPQTTMYNGSMPPSQSMGPPSMMYPLPPQMDRSLMMSHSIHQFPVAMHPQQTQVGPSMIPVGGAQPAGQSMMQPMQSLIPGQSNSMVLPFPAQNLPSGQPNIDMMSGHFHMMPNYPGGVYQQGAPLQGNVPAPPPQSQGQNESFTQASNTHMM